MSKIIFVSSTLPDKELLLSSLQPGYIPYTFFNEVLEADKPTITRVGFVWRNNGITEVPFFNECEELNNLQRVINELSLYTSLQDVDLITCSINSDHWLSFIDELKTGLTTTNINIHYSLNQTGNGVGSDWILESDNVDLLGEGMCFNTKILEYGYILDSKANATNVGEFFSNGGDTLPFKIDSISAEGYRNIVYDNSQGDINGNDLFIEVGDGDVVYGWEDGDPSFQISITGNRTTVLFKVNSVNESSTIKNLDFHTIDDQHKFTPIKTNNVSANYKVFISNVRSNCKYPKWQGGIVGRNSFKGMNNGVVHIEGCEYYGTGSSTSGFSGGIVATQSLQDCVNSTVNFINCSFTGEGVGNYSGGMLGRQTLTGCDSTTINIINCVFTGNTIGKYAGGLVGSHFLQNSINSVCNMFVCLSTVGVNVMRYGGCLTGSYPLNNTTTNTIIRIEDCFTSGELSTGAGGIMSSQINLSSCSGCSIEVKSCITECSPLSLANTYGFGGFGYTQDNELKLENCLFLNEFSRIVASIELNKTQYIKNNVMTSGSFGYLNYVHTSNDEFYHFSELTGDVNTFNTFNTYLSQNNAFIDSELKDADVILFTTDTSRSAHSSSYTISTPINKSIEYNTSTSSFTINVYEQQQFAQSSSSGDPYVNTFSGFFYKLPNKRAVYRLFSSKDVVVNALVDKLPAKWEKTIDTFYRNDPRYKSYEKNIVRGGYFYTRFYIRYRDSYVVLDAQTNIIEKGVTKRDSDNMTVLKDDNVRLFKSEQEGSSEYTSLLFKFRSTSNKIIEVELKRFSNPAIINGISVDVQVMTDDLQGILVEDIHPKYNKIKCLTYINRNLEKRGGARKKQKKIVKRYQKRFDEMWINIL